ncbi:MAG: hypothetical protein ABI053_05570 [Lacisediminihabitans sp.]
MDFYWLIPVIAVAGGITYAILNSYWKSGARGNSAVIDPALTATLAENAAVNKAILEKLGSIDARLAAVEKTLTDIP